MRKKRRHTYHPPCFPAVYSRGTTFRIFGHYLRILLLLPVICLPVYLHGQHYNESPYFLNSNRHWNFSHRTGIRPDLRPPELIPSALENNSGHASVSDLFSGALLFYSDGTTCFDAAHNPMPNGSGLRGNGDGAAPGSTTQGVCIVPFPDAADKYYLFSLNGIGSMGSQYVNPPAGGTLFYSVVDMRLNGGAGDIDPAHKNIPLLQDVYYSGMIAIAGDQCDYWLLLHLANQSIDFLALHITASGISQTPVISPAGFPRTHAGAADFMYTLGGFAVSPDRRKIAMGSARGVQNSRAAESLLCRFDPATGVVSDAVPLVADGHVMAFSPDGSRLYTAGSLYADWPMQFHFIQYDIRTHDSAAIASSMQIMHTAGLYENSRRIHFRQYDSRVYFLDNSDRAIGIIHRPDEPFPACDFRRAALPLPAGINESRSLPNEVPHFPDPTIRNRLDTFLCRQPGGYVPLQLHAPSGFGTYYWPHDGSRETTSVIRKPGTYRVQYGNSPCTLYETAFSIGSIAPERMLGARQTELCRNPGSVVILDPKLPPGVTLIWQDGSSVLPYVIDKPGIYTATIEADGCSGTDTVEVIHPDLSPDLGPDTLICGDDRPELSASFLPGASILWNTGARTATLTIDRPGIYWAEVSRNGCSERDSIQVDFLDIRNPLGPDISWCTELAHTLTISPEVPAHASLRWDNGSTLPDRTINDSGSYTLHIALGNCQIEDTLYVSRNWCTCPVYIPNAFSPNGDGRNDLFRAVLPPDCTVQAYTLRIYSRWGIPVFESAVPGAGWDGSYLGSPAEPGTYMYHMKLQAGTEGTIQELTGDLTLLR